MDPVVIDTTRKESALALANPQLLNAYSYVGNNPLKYVDVEGESLISAVARFFGRLAAPLNVAFVVHDLLKPMKSGDDTSLALAYGLVPDGKGGYTSPVGDASIQNQQPNQIAQNTAQSTPLIVGNTSQSSGIKIGDSFGNLGTVVENAPGEIKGYTSH